MRRNRLQLVLLTVVAIASLIYFIASVTGELEATYGNRVPRNPTNHGFSLAGVSGLTPEAQTAGIRMKDQVMAVNGRPFTSYNVLLEELRKSHAGDPMQISIQHPASPSGSPSTQTMTVQLAPARAERPGILELISRLFFLEIAFPLGCLILGVWVVAARPRDRNAWFLLGIFQYFIALFTDNQYWPDSVFLFTSVWSAIWVELGPLCIMLFGIYFPDRARMDMSIPWFKWLLTGLLLAILPLNVLFNIGFALSFQSVGWLSPHLPLLNQALQVSAMIAIGIYFHSLASKVHAASSPGIRRRLGILYFGSTIGSAPLFLIVLYALFTGRDVGDGVPPYILFPALLLFTLFPLSLAYVVVVQRAMDLRILIRQGTKYALARTSLWFLRALTALLLGIAVVHALHHNPVRWQDAVLVVALALLLLVVRFRTTKVLSSWIDRKFFREAYSTEQVLAELATQAQGFAETPALIRTVSECISNALHVGRIAVLLRSGDTFRLQYATGMEAIDATGDFMLAGNSETIANLDLVRSPANVYLDNPDSWLLAATEAERSALRDLGAEMLLPLRGRSRLLGVMALGPKRSEEAYSPSDRALLQSVAVHTGLSIENSELLHSLAAEAAQRERIHHEIEIAREVQERFLPQSYPEIRGVELAGAYRPAQGVGGDYYDFIEMKTTSPGNGKAELSLGIAIGDVSGKGISAALLMASLRASLRGLTRNSNGDLASMMHEVNELVYEASTSNRYATFFFAHLDPASRQLTYVNAGHNAPALLRRQMGDSRPFEVTRLEAGGPVIGLIPGATYEQSTLALQPGDILLAFTDGISEAMTHEEEEWGEDRLIECLAQCPDMPATALVKCLVEAADTFAGGAPQHDDMTLLVLKMKSADRTTTCSHLDSMMGDAAGEQQSCRSDPSPPSA
jgi:sigma-B regulation protein RsbU (phosphoserine phosphatase)